MLKTDSASPLERCECEFQAAQPVSPLLQCHSSGRELLHPHLCCIGSMVAPQYTIKDKDLLLMQVGISSDLQL